MALVTYLLDHPLIYIWTLCIPWYLFDRRYTRDKREARHIIYFAIYCTLPWIVSFSFDAFSSRKKEKSKNAQITVTPSESCAVFDPEKYSEVLPGSVPPITFERLIELQQRLAVQQAEAEQKAVIDTRRFETYLKIRKLESELAQLERAIAAGSKYPWYSPRGILGTHEALRDQKQANLQQLRQIKANMPTSEPPLYEMIEELSSAELEEALQKMHRKISASFTESLPVGTYVRQNGIIFEKNAEGTFQTVGSSIESSDHSGK